MGKGNRSRNNKYDEVYTMTDSGAAVKTGAKKDRTTTYILIAIAAILLISMALFLFASTGIVGRNDVVVSSENYEIDANMMTYFQNMAYSNTFQQYYNMYYMYVYSGDALSAYNAVQEMMSGYTLKSFFSSALTTAKEVLVLCEGAKAAGVELDAETLAVIEEELANFDGSYAGTFGTGVSEKDIRKAMTLYSLAAKYAGDKTDEIKLGMTAEDIQTYIDENKADFYSADYLTYEFIVKASDFTDDAEGFEAAKALADKYLAELALAKNEEEFKTVIVNYVADRDFRAEFDKNVGEAAVPADEVLNSALDLIKEALIKEFVNEETVGDITVTETYTAIFKAVHTALQTTVAKAVSSVSASMDYKSEITDDTDEYIKWLLADETKAEDSKTIDESSESEYSKIVYLMVEPLHVDDSETQKVAHLLITADRDTAKEEEIAEAKKKAEELLSTFLAGEKTQEAFEELAEKNTEDSNVLYTFPKGQMVAEFENWAFDETRKAGDTEIVQTEYGFHIMYYIEPGKAVYEENALSALADEKYQEYIDKESAALTVNQRVVDKYSK